MKDLIYNQIPKLSIKYKIEITRGCLDDVLKGIQYLLSEYKFQIYATNDGCIHSEKEIEPTWWVQELKSYDIHVNVIKT